jgi:hypothetical protein
MALPFLLSNTLTHIHTFTPLILSYPLTPTPTLSFLKKNLIPETLHISFALLYSICRWISTTVNMHNKYFSSVSSCPLHTLPLLPRPHVGVDLEWLLVEGEDGLEVAHLPE